MDSVWKQFWEIQPETSIFITSLLYLSFVSIIHCQNLKWTKKWWIIINLYKVQTQKTQWFGKFISLILPRMFGWAASISDHEYNVTS